MSDKMQQDAMLRLRQMYSNSPFDSTKGKGQQNTQPHNATAQNSVHSDSASRSDKSSHNNHSDNSSRSDNVSHSDKSSRDNCSDNSSHSDNISHSDKNTHSVLDVFMRDKEKSLIVLLIVILLSEKADTTLILALMYLVI